MYVAVAVIRLRPTDWNDTKGGGMFWEKKDNVPKLLPAGIPGRLINTQGRTHRKSKHKKAFVGKQQVQHRTWVYGDRGTKENNKTFSHEVCY